ncbi:hypothetical protein [Yoonia sp. R2-816]|uniref:hypothetical protein n=1 Tax=Yoonia sp. R2-816 TaxID=3342638 RepID=UPI00372BBE92
MKSFVSGHHTFDQCVNHPDHGYIGQGNVMTPTQFSSYIRPVTRTEYSDMHFPPGQLNAFDLNPFRDHMPKMFASIVETETAERKAILYWFFHRVGRQRVEHGWILASNAHREIASIVTGPTHKSRLVIDTAASWVCQATAS